MEQIKKFDYNSKNAKLGASFLIPAIIFFILSPGVFFEINPQDPKKKIKCNKIIPFSTAGIHSIIYGMLMCAFYYFYLSKKKLTASI